MFINMVLSISMVNNQYLWFISWFFNQYLWFISMFISMDWFKGKITGKPDFSWGKVWFPANFPLKPIHCLYHG